MNLKFLTAVDAKMFCIEVGEYELAESVDESFVPSRELLELLIQKRKKTIGLKDFRKSQNTKEQWRKDRFRMMKGIKSFHDSTKGKRFHRALGRFLATRDFSSGMFKRNEGVSDVSEVCEVLKALSSAKTHSYLRLEYYMPQQEYLDYLGFFEEFIPTVQRMETELMRAGGTITEEDLEFMIRVTERTQVIKELSKFHSVDFAQVKALFEDEEKGKDLDEDGVYTEILNNVKTRIVEGDRVEIKEPQSKKEDVEVSVSEEPEENMTETTGQIKSFADQSGKSVAEVEKLWDELKADLKKEGEVPEDDPEFFRRLVGRLKKALGLDKE